MEAQIILLYAAQYEVIDEKTGVRNRGVTCNYYFNVDLHAEDNTNGSMDYMLMAKIKTAPALYNAKFEMNIGSDGKPVLKIQDLEFISEISMIPSN